MTIKTQYDVCIWIWLFDENATLAKHNELLELWSDSNTYANKQRYGKVSNVLNKTALIILQL